MRVHHVAVRTRDVEGLVGFYREWLGLEVARDLSPRSVWLQARDGGAVLMVEQAGPGEPTPPVGTLDILAVTVSDAERRALRERLATAGMLEAETEHTLYFRDPDGRRVGASSHPL
jgi:catechol 2,3-dioxygenase-like lactoylglutathione lyase family enzyme